MTAPARLTERPRAGLAGRIGSPLDELATARPRYLCAAPGEIIDRSIAGDSLAG